ncbi:hypothetical protein HERIO_293 [Hepatospora eriocheir]|uniref:Uncharacterized protein n=1 Tax=Hepatospora eriocheir TaxID=1081669 RepID=A0A1X0QDE5_9MICR|nr:hypothetical protein HERIO_293 [Hepatospora eriocheir]
MKNIFFIAFLCCTSEANTVTSNYPINNHVNVEEDNQDTIVKLILNTNKKVNEIKNYIVRAVYRSDLYKFLRTEKKIVIHAISTINGRNIRTDIYFLNRLEKFILDKLFSTDINLEKLQTYNLFLNYMFYFLKIEKRLRISYHLSFHVENYRKNIMLDEIFKSLDEAYVICLRYGIFINFNLINPRNVIFNLSELRNNIVKVQLELINFIYQKLNEQFVYFNQNRNDYINESLNYFKLNIRDFLDLV